MSEQQKFLGEVRDTIATLHPDDRDRVHRYAAHIRDFLGTYGPCAEMAFALVGAELAAKADKEST